MYSVLLPALENASADTKALPRVTIIAIVLIVILAALVFLLAVGCCLCRSGRRRRSQHRKHTKACERKAARASSRLHRQQSAADLGGLSRSGSRRSKDDGDNLVVAHYPAFFSNGKYGYNCHEAAAAADVYFKSPFESAGQTDSSSADSKMDYRALARSLSMPNNDDEAAFHLPNGDIPGRMSGNRAAEGNYITKGGSSCSLHLLRNR